MVNDKHPRAASLKIRDLLVHGVDLGLTSRHGLIAQGRGEAFDYLIGEKTQDFALEAIRAASALLLLAKFPVLSINGNSAALSSPEYIALAKLLNCPIEVNLFHRTLTREQKIQKYLKNLGAQQITGVGENASAQIKGIASPRKFVSPYGIAKADVVFVPLEDGDRTEALIKMGKKVITIDLNPLSRTAQKATITIVDNIVRAFPLIIRTVEQFKKLSEKELIKATCLPCLPAGTAAGRYNNKAILQKAIQHIRQI